MNFEIKLRCLILARNPKLFGKAISALRAYPNVVICGAERSLQSGAFLVSLLEPDVVLIEDQLVKSHKLALKTLRNIEFLAISESENELVCAKTIGSSDSVAVQDLTTLLSRILATYRYNKLNAFLSLRNRAGIHVFTVSKIDWIEAIGKTVRIHFIQYSMEFPMRIGAFLQNIKANCLLRVDRSMAINVDNIESISRSNNRASVKTFDGNEILIGRRGYYRLVTAVQDSIGLIGTRSEILDS